MTIDEFIAIAERDMKEAETRGTNKVILFSQDIKDSRDILNALTDYFHNKQWGVDIRRCTRGTWDIILWK